MPTIDTNTLSVRAIEEVTFGTTPATPTLQELRVTGDSLVPAKNTITSNIIRNDASVDSILRTLINMSGGLPIELVYGAEFELFLTGLMRSTITSAFELGTFSIDKTGAGAGEVDLTRASGDFTSTFTTDMIGAMMRVWDGSTSQGIGKIKSIAALLITLEDPNDNFSDLTGDANEQFDVRFIRNGTTLRSYSIEEEVISDVPTSYFAVSTGARVAGLSLSITAEGLLTGEWTFEGLDLIAAAAAISGETVTPPGSTKPMSASGDVNEVWEGLVFNNCITDLSIAITNNPRTQTVIGQVTPKGIGFGRFTPTGSITFLKADNVMLDKLRNHTASSLDIFGTDQDGNVLVITIPQIRYTDGGDEKPGADSDVTFSGGWGAERDATMGDNGAMMQFSLFPSIPLT